MISRSELSKAFGLALIAAVISVGCATERSPDRPDSLVLITLDTLRADHVGVYAEDSPAATPRMDALAAEGAIVQRAWSTVPLTTPAHASILTGLYPPAHGVRNNARFRLPDDVTTLAEVLAQKGHRTAAFVSAFTTAGVFGLAQGFEVYDDDLGHSDTGRRRTQRPGGETLERALGWLDEHHDEPFFLWVHFFDPHTPYSPPPEFARQYPGDPYSGEVAYTDALVGQLLDALATHGVDDHTVVVALADHGEGLGTHGEQEHGILLYEEVLHVPFFIKAPGLIEPGSEIPGPASVVDVLPTVASLLNFELEEAVDGRDLLDPTQPAPETYAETLYPFEEFGWSALYALREEDLKLIESSRPELYDLAEDPKESANLHDDRSDDAGRLRDKLNTKAESIVREDRLAAAAGFGGGSDPETIARLESLGYVAGGGAAATGDEGSSAMPAVAGRPPREGLEDYDLFKRAQELMRAGDLDTAVSFLERLVDNDPSNPQFLLNLCRALDRADRPDEARERFRELIERHETFYLGYRAYSDFLESRGEPLESRRIWLRLQGLLPGYVGIVERIARAEIAAGLAEQAVARLRDHLDVQPGDSASWAMLGDALAATEQDDEALEAYRRALSLAPTQRRAVEGAVDLLEEAGRRGEAVELVEGLLERAPGDPLLVVTRRSLENGGDR
jgi:arylsulfatase A-like enzyme/Flp pilus assembly protein TadD